MGLVLDYVARRWLPVTAIILVAIIVCAYIFIAASVDAADTFYLVFIAGSFGPPVIAIVATERGIRELDPLSPFVLVPLTMGIVFGSAPSLLAFMGYSETASEVGRGLAWGMLAYLLGAVAASLAIPTPRPPDVGSRRIRGELDPGILYAVYGTGAFAMIWYWYRAGGIPILEPDVENARLAALTGGGLPFYLSMLMMVSVWLLCSPACTRTSTGVRCTLVLMTVLLLTSTGWRNTVFAFIVVLLMIRQYTRPIRTISILVAGILAILGAVAIGLYRVYSSGLANYETFQLLSTGNYGGAISKYLTTYFNAFGLNIGAVYSLFPDIIPFKGGETIVWNYLALLPGESRQPFDFVLKDAAGQGFAGGGLPPTLIGELYLNFGTSGVAIGMVIIGAFATLIHALLKITGRVDVLIISILLIYYLFVAVRGGIGNVSMTVVWLAVAVWAVSRLASGSRNRTERSTGKV
ncbi:O-antigen polysaccharide polymerase Wzy [Gordonia polyisoprenivorans]|uniref:O-antigen polysaccharide polymerase Wzy n=1 Tax=Gordonia polyisoprenivorans TaxID=84595 RepID=UPI001AD717BE|nr:O-antigen polysaccharide polymerase Wzy [Gordonia polyisoprenivorans]QTI70545.1 oligosaccharide repeat unit polymerase [Gordonia polyisoprenivorans]